MFSLQATLAKNPIPTLQSSCDKFLEWTQPLLSQQEFNNTQKIVEAFTRPGGEGEQLQNTLENWAMEESKTSWISPVWLDLYLASRYPLPINSNVFYYLKNKFNTDEFSQTQIASALVRSVLAFNLLIESEKLSIDRQKDQPLCMEQYKSLFSAMRLPQKGKDKLLISSGQTHIVVLFKKNIFKLKVIDDFGKIYAFNDIENALQEILNVTTCGQNIGILTTQPRDDWADGRITLEEYDTKNKEQLKVIEEAIFTLSLDENSPEQLIETSQMLLHGDGKDRYFDKSLQFIVFKNGKTGVNFEHTGMDGAVMLRMIGHIYDNIEKCPTDKTVNVIIKPEQLTFKLNEALNEHLVRATAAYEKATHNTQTRIMNFTQFGKNKIKSFKMSPDAFLQVALQLAEYKAYGKCTSAYEAIMTRGFVQGRIDVLYTVSMETKAFIENIDNEDCDKQTKIMLLRKAAEKHISRASECRQGVGIHTHLLALIRCFETQGKNLNMKALPEIFTDTGYKTLTHNIICTSTTSEYGVELAGYGPVVEDGYGIRYFNRADTICFNITSRTANKENLDLLLKCIEESLLEMASLMQ
jgi:carnitine O-acetyltransferase